MRKRFLRDFPVELGDALGDLAPSLVEALTTDAAAAVPSLSPGDVKRLRGFAEERRLFEPTRGSLVRLATAMLPVAGAWRAVGETGWTALIVRVLQGRSWEASARAARVSGRNALIVELRCATGALLALQEDLAVERCAGHGAAAEG